MPFRLGERYAQPFGMYRRLNSPPLIVDGNINDLAMVNQWPEVHTSTRFLYTRLYNLVYRGANV